MHFLGSDKSIVQRTQYFNYEVLDERPVRFFLNLQFMIYNYALYFIKIPYAPYFTISSFTTVLMMIIGGLTFATLANFKFGRSLLLRVC
jgi:hypothetical protein